MKRSIGLAGWIWGFFTLFPAAALGSTVYLECTLASTSSSTASDEVKTIERSGVLLEVDNAEGIVEIRSQNVSIPIEIKIASNIKEWRSGEAYVYDENRSSGRRYSLLRMVEDAISITRTHLDLDRTTGRLTQETTQELGEGLVLINIISGTCLPAKKQPVALF